MGSATVDALKAIARSDPGRGGYNAGDQGVLNKWIHAEEVPLEVLPEEYNLIKKDYADIRSLNRCRLLHLAGAKPWIERARGDGEACSLGPVEQLWHG